MLDFYDIARGSETPDHPDLEKLQEIGSLDLKTFVNLQKKGIIEESYNFFSDFRWDEPKLILMLNKCNTSRFEGDTEVQQLLTIIQANAERGMDVIAYCD